MALQAFLMKKRTQLVVKRIGKRLREIRKARELSQELLAYKAGLERAYYWKLENGRMNVTVETLVRVADVLKVDVSVLFEPFTRK